MSLNYPNQLAFFLMKLFVFMFAVIVFGNTVVASIKTAKSADIKAAELICKVTESC